jgi:hypothetical protein
MLHTLTLLQTEQQQLYQLDLKAPHIHILLAGQ